MITFDKKVTILPEVLSQELDGETVLLDLQSEKYFGLDEVGSRIWQLLQERKPLQEVYDTLLEEYEVGESQLRKDLQEHLTELTEAGLITLDSA